MNREQRVTWFWLMLSICSPEGTLKHDDVWVWFVVWVFCCCCFLSFRHTLWDFCRREEKWSWGFSKPGLVGMGPGAPRCPGTGAHGCNTTMQSMSCSTALSRVWGASCTSLFKKNPMRGKREGRAKQTGNSNQRAIKHSFEMSS